MTSSAPPHIIVTAAVIERDGRFLVTRRLRGTHLEGYWEFPGGKCEPDEALDACLRREILEELGCDVVVGAEIHTVTHTYPERVVTLHFFSCELLGDPRALLGQAMQWVARTDLKTLDFPPADSELIAMLIGRTQRKQGKASRRDR